MSSFAFSFVYFCSLPFFPSGRYFLYALIRFRQPFSLFFISLYVFPLASVPFRRWRPRKEFKTIKRKKKISILLRSYHPFYLEALLVGLEKKKKWSHFYHPTKQPACPIFFSFIFLALPHFFFLWGVRSWLVTSSTQQAFGFGSLGKRSAAVVLVLACARDGFATCESVCMPHSYVTLSNKPKKPTRRL